MSNLHIDGFNKLLTDASISVDDAETPNLSDLPRVVVFPDQGASVRENLCGDVTGKVTTIQTTCIGETRAQAGLMLDKVTAVVEGQRPAVAGWQCTRIEQLFTQPARRDDDTDPAVFYAVASWRFTAVPA